ncbi:MAG: regulatory protein [Bacteroidota bacterium]|nr:regulatory protein [Bacteroidota bacterium]
MSAARYIISVSAKNRNSGKCRIALSDGSEEIYSLDLALKFGLAKGNGFNEPLREQINREQRIIDAKQAAYNFVSYKMRSSRQVSEKLKTKGFDDNEIEEALKFLTGIDLLDDKKFAAQTAKYLIERKNLAGQSLIAELRMRGLSKTLAEEAVVADGLFHDEYELAMRAGEKKIKSLIYKKPEKLRSSLVSFLQRKGYSWDTIRSVSERLIAGIEVDDLFNETNC